MSFFKILQESTTGDREYLLQSPIIGDSIAGCITLAEYGAFLLQAYHHVKHTVPLLMLVGSRLSEDKEWLRVAVAEYIEEELGHQEWILNDIEACGFDKEKARLSTPNTATELMVAYAYDTVQRVDPIGFFGMVHVLEGTSISVADAAAKSIQKTLHLPDSAFSYLTSHGALDLEHVKFFESLMNKILNANDQQRIIHSAKMFYQLYGNVFRSLEESQALSIKNEAA